MNGQNPSNQSNEFNNGSVLGNVEQNPLAPAAPVQQAIEQTSVAQAPVQQAIEQTPIAQAPVQQAIEQTPIAQAPVQQAIEQTPVVQAPVQQAVEQTPVVQTPVQQAVEQTPVAQVIPGTEGIVSTQGSGTNVANSQNASFMNQQKATNIGTVPPSNEKEKKPMNKIVFIALIVVLILGVAYGVYYFLTLSKKKIVLNVKDVQLVSDVDVPTNISFYANVVSGDTSICKVDVANINTSNVGTYEAIITCGEDTYTSKVTVVDKTAPDVLTNIVIKPVNGNVEANEFINSCVDNSNSECTSSFGDNEALKTNLQTVGGPYEIDIETADSSNNVTSSKGILYVTSIEPYLYTRCSSQEIEQTINNYKVSKVIEDFFVIGNDATEGFNYIFLNTARRIYRYTFETEEDYTNATIDRTDNITFNEITGHASFDNDKKQLVISTDLPINILESENNGTFPSVLKDIRTLYETEEKGYHCTNAKYSSIVNE